MDTDYYGYIYKITNLINNKVYIGQHKGNHFDEHYWGSGKLIRKAILRYGKENFTREILERCYSPDELNAAEIKWISAVNSVNEGYNITLGRGGFSMTPEQRKIRSEQTKRWFAIPGNRERQSLAHKGNPGAYKGETAETNEHIRRRTLKYKLRLANGEIVPGMLGKKHSAETIKKQSECKIGELNPFYGKHHTEDAKARMGAKLKGHPTSIETKKKISAANSGSGNGMYGKVANNAGKICITNGDINKYINSEELSIFIELG